MDDAGWIMGTDEVVMVDPGDDYAVQEGIQAWHVKGWMDDAGWIMGSDMVTVYERDTAYQSEARADEIRIKRAGDSTGVWRTGDQMAVVYEYGTGNRSEARYDEIAQKRAGDSTGQWGMAADSIPVYSKVEGRTVYVRADQAKDYLRNDSVQYAKNKKFVPRKDPRKGSENRQPSGARERNVGHPEGEEHSRKAKGNNSIRRIESNPVSVPDWAITAVAGVVTVGVAVAVAASAPVAVVYGIATVIKRELETSPLPSSLDNAL